MAYCDEKINDFLDALSGGAPAPGGGGAAALAGALGISLGSMVGSLTVGKKTYADVEVEIKEMQKKAEQLKEDFLSLMDEDEECFKPLSEAYKMPAGTEEEKRIKEDEIERCSQNACTAPLKIMKKCCEAIDLIKAYSEKGSRLAVSDAGCAAALAKAALEAASLNIYINTKYLKDRKKAEELNGQAENMIKEYGAIAEDVFLNVKNNLCKEQ